jgi:hypothetical protein
MAQDLKLPSLYARVDGSIAEISAAMRDKKRACPPR